MSFIPYGRQDISQEDIDSVVSVLQSDFLTQGPKVPAFESALCDYTGAQNARAVNSATSALHLACLALDLGNEDILWTSPVTFVASANCALYCGASVDFVDIDPNTYNLCPIKLRAKLEQASLTGQLPKVVVAVHLCGQPCDMKAIFDLSQEFNFKIIEDASHAIGARYHDSIIGSCQYSDITVFSFHPVKIVTTAEGGAALTNDLELAEKIDLLRSHGITRDADKIADESHGPWYYQQIDLGFNYRMTELQAALGLSQMERLDQFVASRNRLAERYDDLLSVLPIQIPKRLTNIYSAFHLYVIQLDLDAVKSTHKEVFESLRQRQIGVNLHYIPVHTQPYYQKLGFKSGDFPASERYYKRAISLPLFHSMSEIQQDQVVEALTEVLA